NEFVARDHQHVPLIRAAFELRCILGIYQGLDRGRKRALIPKKESFGLFRLAPSSTLFDCLYRIPKSFPMNYSVTSTPDRRPSNMPSQSGGSSFCGRDTKLSTSTPAFRSISPAAPRSAIGLSRQTQKLFQARTFASISERWSVSVDQRGGI